MLSSGDTRVYLHQADTLDFNQFFLWVRGQRFESAAKLLKLAGVKTYKHSECWKCTSVFGAVKHKLLRKLETEQMRQIFWTAKSIQVLGHADSFVLELSYQVFYELAARFSFVLAGA